MIWLVRLPGFVSWLRCPRNMRLVYVVAAAVAVAAFPAVSTAQRTGHIIGAVEDSAGSPVPQAQVHLLGTALATTTSELGKFMFADVKPGVYFLRVRRLGYDPFNFRVEVRSGDTVSLAVQVTQATSSLAPVVVRENAVSARLSEVGFESRRRYSGAPPARFVTRSQIEKVHPSRLTQMLARMTLRTSECVNAVIYVDGMLVGRPPLDDPPALVKPSRNDTLARVGNPPPRDHPLNHIPPNWVEGMEVYAGPSEIPSQYNPPGQGAECVILVWTR